MRHLHTICHCRLRPRCARARPSTAFAAFPAAQELSLEGPRALDALVGRLGPAAGQLLRLRLSVAASALQGAAPVAWLHDVARLRRLQALSLQGDFAEGDADGLGLLSGLTRLDLAGAGKAPWPLAVSKLPVPRLRQLALSNVALSGRRSAWTSDGDAGGGYAPPPAWNALTSLKLQRVAVNHMAHFSGAATRWLTLSAVEHGARC